MTFGSIPELPEQLAAFCPIRIGVRDMSYEITVLNPPLSLHSKRLEGGIPMVGIKSCLEFGEQFAGDGSDVADAGHRQQYSLGAGVESDL